MSLVDVISSILFYTSQKEAPTLFPASGIRADTSFLLLAVRSVTCAISTWEQGWSELAFLTIAMNTVC